MTLDDLSKPEQLALVEAARGEGPAREAAWREIYRRCEPLIRGIINRSALGEDPDAAQSEAHIALLQAVRDYEPHRGPFGGFLSILVRSRLISLYKFHTQPKRDKRRTFSLMAPIYDGSQDLDDAHEGCIADPRDNRTATIDRQQLRDVWPEIRRRLSKAEAQAVWLHWGKGFTLPQCAEILTKRGIVSRQKKKITAKSIDNALNRATTKLGRWLAVPQNRGLTAK